MNNVLVRLNISEEQYADMRMTMWLRYCMDFVSNYQNELQKLVANTALNQFYNRELAKCEEEFLAIMDAFEGEANIKPADALAMYHKCTLRMGGVFSKPLIEQAKATNIYTYGGAQKN